MNLLQELNNLNLGEDIEFYLTDTLITFSYPKYNFYDLSITRDEDDVSNLEKVKNIFSCQYKIGESICRYDYFESMVVINKYTNSNLSDNYDISSPKEIENGIFYEIGGISDEFYTFLSRTFIEEPFLYFTSFLRIYNANTALKIPENRISEINYAHIINTISFDLYHKHDLLLRTEKMDPEMFAFPDDDELKRYEDSISIQRNTNVNINRYDSDLLSYYNRASLMESSEFKYLAYYQVLECIFDEVYKYEIIEDVKGILLSNWFSATDSKNINALIDIVDRYNKEKNDRFKTKLVLEKYFLGQLHQEAYFLVNKEIIQLLLKMGLIIKDSDINDLQKLASIIYDFRCSCTHSNRSFPIKNSTVISNNNLENYIELIRKVSERIILNYR